MVQALKSAKLVLVILAAGMASGRALAFDVGALAAEDPTTDYFFVAAVLLILTVLVALWSAGGASAIRRFTRGPHAENLFLNILLQSQAPGSTPVKAYLRKVDLNTATVVSHQNFPKGSSVRLELSSLPQFQGESDYVTAKVIQTQAVRGDPPSYIITFGWGELPEKSQQDLSRYIANLSGERHFAPG